MRGILIKRLTRKKLATNLVHSSTTDRAFAFHSRFAIFHGNFDGVWIFTLRAAFYTIHLCHSSIHLLSPQYVVIAAMIERAGIH